MDAFSGKQRIFGGNITKNHSIIILCGEKEENAKKKSIRWHTTTGKPHWETDTHFISQFIIIKKKNSTPFA